jgi:hypothetical protein
MDRGTLFGHREMWAGRQAAGEVGCQDLMDWTGSRGWRRPCMDLLDP